MWTYVVVGLIGVAVIAVAALLVGSVAGLWMLKREQRRDLGRHAEGDW